MFLRKSLSNNKIYLSFVQGYRDENGKVKQKTVEKIGYLEDLKKLYEDPIKHFKEVAKQRNSEEITELVIKNLNSQILSIDDDNQKNIGYIIIKKLYQDLGIKNFLNNKQKNLKVDYKLNDIFSLLIFSRILYPASKKETYEKRNAYFENFNFSEENMYRSLLSFAVIFKNNRYLTLFAKGFYNVNFLSFSCCTL